MQLFQKRELISMNINFFLYRRFCHWITCQLKLSSNSIVTLKNKYEIASFQDVFCHPFYWQVFNWVDNPPKLVVDCGAHCGHFSILADLCFQNKFEDINTDYILVEPNPYLIPIINKNLTEAKLAKRSHLIQGLLGSDKDTGILWIPNKNFLQSSTKEIKGAKPHKINYVDLAKIIGNRSIDLLKIDIEGGEFDLIESHLSLFDRSNLVFIELHNAPEHIHQKFFEALNSVSLSLATKPLVANGQQLMIFQKQPACILTA